MPVPTELPTPTSPAEVSPNEDVDAEINHRARRQALRNSNSNLAKACRALGPTEFDEWKLLKMVTTARLFLSTTFAINIIRWTI